jgi:hypothetical protein
LVGSVTIVILQTISEGFARGISDDKVEHLEEEVVMRVGGGRVVSRPFGLAIVLVGAVDDDEVLQVMVADKDMLDSAL